MFASQQNVPDFPSNLSSSDFGVDRSSFIPKPPELLLSQSYIPEDIVRKLDELNADAITLGDLQRIGAGYFRNNPTEVQDIINELKRYGNNRHYRATYLIDLALNTAIQELQRGLGTYSDVSKLLELLNSSDPVELSLFRAFGQSAKLFNCAMTIYRNLLQSGEPNEDMVHIAFSLVPLLVDPRGLGLPIIQGVQPGLNLLNNIFGSSN